MALTQDDLKFALTVEPEFTAMQEGLKRIGDEISAQSKKAKSGWEAMSQMGARQSAEIAARAKIATMSEFPEVLEVDKKTEAIENFRAALKKQREDAKIPTVTAAPKGLDLKQMGGAVLGSLAAGGGVRGALGAALGSLTAIAGPAGIAIAGVAAGLKVATDVMYSFRDAVVSFAKVASPATYDQYRFAIEDLHGVIGRMLIPILQMFTETVRLVGDSLATILPNSREAANALAPLRIALTELFDTIRQIMADIGPIIREINIGFLRGLAFVIGQIAFAARSALLPLQMLLATFGILGTGDMRTSMGAAARQASITGLEDYQKQLQIAAYSIPGEEIGPEEQQVTLLTKILEVLTNKLGGDVAAATMGVVDGVKRAILGW